VVAHESSTEISNNSAFEVTTYTLGDNILAREVGIAFQEVIRDDCGTLNSEITDIITQSNGAAENGMY
jgi:hypothetical protein